MSIVLAPCHCFTLRNFKQLQHSNMSSKQNNLQVTQLQPKTKCLHPQLQPKTKCPTPKSAYTKECLHSFEELRSKGPSSFTTTPIALCVCKQPHRNCYTTECCATGAAFSFSKMSWCAELFTAPESNQHQSLLPPFGMPVEHTLWHLHLFLPAANAFFLALW